MIRIENLRKEFDKGVVALDSINLTFDEGSFIALLGPSGCGKTTTLNCIAGLLEPTSGSIYFDDRDVTNLAPKDRNIGMVFQSYALYPHMKVIDNIAFSLKQKGMPKAERHEKARQMARKLQIEHLLDRMPGELSGGQQQRVSMARALVKAFGAKPVLVVPQDCVHAVEQMAPVAGLHLYHSVEEALAMPFSVGMEVFTKNAEEAEACADAILAKGRPAACIAIEAPGANELGQYHNAVGKNTTAIEAKSDILFVKCQQLGVWNLAVGDLGNELGMGALKEHLHRYVPYMGKGQCTCGCGGGIESAVAADNLLTATVSDWGVYAMIAMTAYLLRTPDVMHTAEMEREMVVTASRCGMLDMYGWLVPAIIS